MFGAFLGPERDVQAAAEFIEDEFRSLNQNPNKVVYCHFTTATDTSNIHVVFKVVLDTIIKENLEAAQLL
jgi:hypothetical protein